MKRTWLYVVLAVFSSWPLTYADSHPPITLDDSLVWTAAIDETADKVNDDIKPTSKFYPVTKLLSQDLKGLWVVTGSMSKPRVEHTATLLKDGKVLVVGGFYNDGADRYLATAELYNPVSGTWAITGSLAKARTRHTATKLTDGKVLVAGGLFYNGIAYEVLNSAAIYDPATKAWTTTGVMKLGRYWHTATLLANGKVLVVGGSSNPNNSTISTNNAELYDPATGTWSLVAAMTTPRVYHTATLLNSGNLLIIGGQNGTAVLDSAVVYNPTTNAWSPAGTMRIARVFHTANLLHNGNVLVMGGYKALDVPFPNESALYNPSAGSSWSDSAALLNNARYSHTATMLYTGRVLVAGGISNADKGGELYNPVIPTTSYLIQTLPMPTVRFGHTATLLTNSEVLISGGYFYDGTDHYHASAELYKPYPGGQVVPPADGGCNSGPAAPVATSSTASAITADGAKLSGEVNDNCADTKVSFELGLTANKYDIATPEAIIQKAGTGIKMITASVTKLFCKTTFHYRVKAENSVGITYGSDATFTTLPCNLVDLTITLDDKRTVLSAGDSYVYTAILKNASTSSSANKSLFKAPDVTGLNITKVVCKSVTIGAICPNTDVATLKGDGIEIAVFPKGSSLTFTIDATVTAGAPLGNLKYTAMVTPPSSVMDTNLLNNSASDIDRVVSRPDFTITDITLSPSSLPAQTNFTVAVAVKNQGNAIGNAGVLGLWLNKTGSMQPACNTITDVQKNAGVIAAGATSNVTFTGISTGIAGKKNLVAFVDSTCLTAETRSDNNSFSKQYVVQAPVVPSQTPDLTITAVTIDPISPTVNNTFNVKVRIKNQGNYASDVAFIDVWANQSATPACGAAGTEWKDVPVLAAGATTDITVENIPAGTVTGSKLLQVFVDSWCEIAELSETNNKKSYSYIVK